MRMPLFSALTVALVNGWFPSAFSAGSPGLAAAEPASVLVSEFIYDKAPFPSCHASTIADTPAGPAAAWFGGTDEGNADVGIWFSRHQSGAWSAPVEIANGVETETRRYPCWNPVLYQAPGGPLVLFYKVGPNPRQWWGMRKQSTNGGATWSDAERLPEGVFGPIKNKPWLLADGRLLCGSSTEHEGWRVHLEWTADLGKTWSRTEPLNDGKEVGAIQPTILQHSADQLQILCRARGVGRVLEARSKDAGRTWSKLSPLDIPNPNSGIDAVTLRDGRHLLVYNHTPRGRTPLNVAVSPDGQNWEPKVTLEESAGEYSYPAVIQAADGRVHITYTWKRQRIKHVVLDPTGL